MMENDIFRCLVEREREEEKWWGPQVFSSPLQNTISPNWRETWSDKWEKYLDKTVPPLFNVYGSFIFSFDFSFVRLAFWFFFFFFVSLVLSGCGFFFFSFFFILNFYFYYFFKKMLLDDFLFYFLKCPLLSIHNFKKKI